MEHGREIRTILVTGGAGFIGTHLCRKLVSQGRAVAVLDLKKPEAAIEGVRYAQGDVRNAEALRECLRQADAVYHLAATVSVPLCQNDPLESYSNNFTATLNVLDAIREKAASEKKKPIPLVFASSAAVYGNRGDDGHALSESETAPEFLSFYAAQKHASEKAIDLYARYHGVPSTVFRFFNVFGPGQDPSSPYSGVITLFMKYAAEGRPLPLNDGGKPTRDFISVHDIVDGLVRPLDLPPSAWRSTPLNLATGRSVSIRRLAETVAKLCAHRSELVIAPPREGDILHSLADVRKAKSALGFEATRGLEASLAEMTAPQGPRSAPGKDREGN